MVTCLDQTIIFSGWSLIPFVLRAYFSYCFLHVFMYFLPDEHFMQEDADTFHGLRSMDGRLLQYPLLYTFFSLLGR